jgi:hypothetical protein
MTEHKASRTLVKSPPELWAECSEATSLTRHLDHFGEIKITRLEPETAVAWEGERMRGTVRLEPSGWGTTVTLTAVAVDGEGGSAEPPPVVATEHAEPAATPETAAVEPVAEAVEPVAAAEPDAIAPPPSAAPPDPPVAAPPARRGFFARVFGLMASKPAPTSDRAAPSAPAPEPAYSEPEPVAASEPEPPVAEPEPAPVAVVEPELEPEPEPPAHEPEPRAAPEPSIVDELADAESALIAALDSLGQAHHRPFSRA